MEKWQQWRDNKAKELKTIGDHKERNQKIRSDLYDPETFMPEYFYSTLLKLKASQDNYDNEKHEQEYEKMGFFSPNLEFALRFARQFWIEKKFDIKDNKDDVEYVPRPDVIEFIGGIRIFINKMENAFDTFIKNEISLKGNKTTSIFSTWINSAKEDISFLRDIDSIGQLEKRDLSTSIKLIMFMRQAFELFTVVNEVKPDLIITLTNGASRLHYICEALGFDSSNFLSIHRNAGKEGDENKNIEPIYQGKEIKPGMRVLILEDTTLLKDDRTYIRARNFLNKFDVKDTPVFLEYVYEFGNKWASYEKDIDKKVEIQEVFDNENIFVSTARSAPPVMDEFWNVSKGNLVDMIKHNKKSYDDFFEYIRKLGSSTLDK